MHSFAIADYQIFPDAFWTLISGRNDYKIMIRISIYLIIWYKISLDATINTYIKTKADRTALKMIIAIFRDIDASLFRFDLEMIW